MAVGVHEIRPFRVSVTADAMTDLHDRLSRTRWPDQLSGSGWSQGADVSYVRALCDYWLHEFDWRAAENELNGWPQYRTVIDGQTVHFLHVRSPHAEAMPLLLTHGWPGSIWEFADLLGPLTDPVAHGGRRADAFHVVCPSIPGYGWSGPTTEPGWDIQRVARMEGELMQLLGYERFGAQGGDWGSMATANLAVHIPDRLVGIHLNLVMVQPPDVVDDDLGRAELARRAELDREERGYSAIQRTKPQTLAFGLTDSPAGLAAWMLEKYRSWTDCGGDLESVLTRDMVLRNIATYWFTATVASSARLYYESHRSGRSPLPDQYVSVPTACALFPKELWRPPRAWAERAYNVVRWTEHPKGGHFAAMEQPAALAEDLREFFGPLWRRAARDPDKVSVNPQMTDC
ncbi:epoxide hydrolase [Jatrophihabitans cynanchi]|uniref:Epoxide hydrolase n=1 Tax=Jatrophihabitans cynanchi TaxID=2944128 RepID=A0ABY7K323_9ACTN|nr:epoxide hydrolase family protein [Jatrophihabitans sp. SB3-54]WAX58395.1 epoxide hydrolase [Jatrophihabitans sp. SB3-54]